MQDNIKPSIDSSLSSHEINIVNLHNLAACPILNYLSHEGEKRRMVKISAALKAPTTKQRYMRLLPRISVHQLTSVWPGPTPSSRGYRKPSSTPWAAAGCRAPP